MSNETLDGIPLTDMEKTLIRNERLAIERYRLKQMLQKVCLHEDTRYIGSGHGEDMYECRKCGKSIFE